MTQPVCSEVERIIVLKRVVQFFVDIERSMEIFQYLGSLQFRVALVEDDGVGFAQKGISKVRSFGLAGMRERIVALGGCVKVRSSKGRGTRIEVTVPDVTSPAPLPAMAADSAYQGRGVAVSSTAS